VTFNLTDRDWAVTNRADLPPGGGINNATTRGFTNQEEFGVAGLVHLNGRIYAPLLGRMTSADPTVPDALNAQAWNRYSYVGNDPLTFTDPKRVRLSALFKSPAPSEIRKGS
jgi:RHS repeat-associated protein